MRSHAVKNIALFKFFDDRHLERDDSTPLPHARNHLASGTHYPLALSYW